MKLPASVQEIADVIGAERALFLIGQLPRCYVKDSRKREANKGGLSERVLLYVPKSLKPDHTLVRILGWHDAQRLVAAFGGEMLSPGNCWGLYSEFRNNGIARLVASGTPVQLVACWFGVSEKLVKNVIRSENPQVGIPAPANDNRANHTQGICANERHSPASRGHRRTGG